MVAIRRDGEGDPIPMTVEEYFAFADEQDVKYEYVGGYVYAMAGGTVRHGTITANMIRQLGNKLDDKDCTVTSPDVRVQVNADRYRYPDVTVFCGDPAYHEGRTDTITNPALLVEVSSPDSGLLDHGEKLDEYLKLDSLQAYIIVAQDTVRVERYVRRDDGQWLYTSVSDMDGTVEVPSLGLMLSVADIYRKVRWDEGE